jgi:filamentous hemagglutinin family protein
MRLRQATVRFALLAGTCLVALRPAVAGELPAGASVAHGSVGISSPGANTMTIQQSSAAAIVNWQSFSIGAGATVNVQQPNASSALLNRVTGATTSTIAGGLNANGQVYLVNPNGIVITPTGTVRAGGGFVASTLGITDEDFKAGRRNFAGTGNSAAVVNRGTIEVGRGGYAALLGGAVENAGTISVPLGRIGLGAGERATLDISGDGFLEVAVPSSAPGDKALIQHSGRIRADGGRVEMKAATAREVARQAISLTGVVEARSVRGRSGAIVLGGGAGGAVNISGRLDASATRQSRRTAAVRSRPSVGGTVTVTGDKIRLTGATIDASGRKGGGTVRIGGDLQGGGTLQRASSTIVDSKTQILADATETGDGGKVIVWSDAFTSFAGLISARGGANGGNGGFAEVSSKRVLAYTGRTILTAVRGKFGTLLLDPYDIYIEDGPTTGGSFTPSGDNSVINVTDLQNALATANVTISTSSTDSTALQAGNITVGVPLSWSQATTLTLNADNNIIIAGDLTGRGISAPAGGLVLNAGGTITTPLSWTTSSGGAGVSCAFSPCAPGSVNVGTFVLQGGTWTQTGPLYNNAAFSATDFRLEGGSFLRVLGGDGSTANPYQIYDVYGLQGINSIRNSGGSPDLSLNYQLANNIDASGTRQWTDGSGVIGFTPIGGSGSRLPDFSGTFDGQGHTISGLYINRPSSPEVGLFGWLSGSVLNLTLSGVDITGGSAVGSVVGRNFGDVSYVVASGSVTGNQAVGGLVGDNTPPEGTSPPIPSITQSSASVTVQGGTNADAVGGLVGYNGGDVSFAYATGAVSAGPGSTAIGGLAGYNNGGTLSQVYATGLVNGTGAQFGGLVGFFFSGTLTSSFWDTTTTGQAQAIGSSASGTSATATGLTTAQFQDPGTFVPQAESQGWSFETNWAPPSPSFYPELYAIAPVIRAVSDNPSRPYGDPTTLTLVTSYGGPGTFVFGPPGDTVSLTNALASPATATSPVGTYAITGVNQVSSGGVAYRVVATQSSAALTPSVTVTPAPLTVTANDQSKTYGTPFGFSGVEYTAAGLRNGETIGAADLSSAGAPGSAAVGLYPILIGNAAGGTFSPSNYSMTYVPGTLSVAPAALVVSALNQVKALGLPFSFTGLEFIASGLQNGETIGSAALSSLGALAAAGPGLYPIQIGSVAGGTFSPSNYSISFVPGTMVVSGGPSLIDTPPAGNPNPNLPPITVALPNPPDTFDFTGPGGGSGGGGPTLGPGTLREPATIERSSNSLEAKVASCDSQFERSKNASAYKVCVGDALEQFADALEARGVDLPAPLRGIPAVIRQAARQVRAARTIQEARAAVGSAVAEVRKAIALIRADDPAIGRLQIQQANRIASALGAVESKLSRATGL